MKKSRRNFVKKSALGAAGFALGLQNLKATGIGSILGVNTESDIGESSIDLLKDKSAWSTFTPRKEITPIFSKRQSEVSHGNPALTINGNNNPESIGCWERGLPLLEKGHTYQIKCEFQAENIKNLNEHLRAFVIKNEGGYADFYLSENRDGNKYLKAEFSPVEDEESLEIQLYLVSGGQGKVQWNEVLLTDITEGYTPRIVNVAAVSGKPGKVNTSSEAITFYCNRIDKIGTANLDLICLPEFINVDNVPGEPAELAEAIPGPSTKRLGEKAKQYNTYIAVSLLERDNNHIYNTAILIGRDGKIVGKYHKVHLPFIEKFIWGVSPGSEYKVFETDFGKIGLMVCYDNHFPEVARILAVKGADLIAYPNYGDGREWPNGPQGSVWEPYIRTRAIDSHVAIVSAVNSGRSCIVNGGGEILAVNGYSAKEPGSIVTARVDLNSSVVNYSGMPIQKRYLMYRQSESYGPLINKRWDFE